MVVAIVELLTLVSHLGVGFNKKNYHYITFKLCIYASYIIYVIYAFVSIFCSVFAGLDLIYSMSRYFAHRYILSAKIVGNKDMTAMLKC